MILVYVKLLFFFDKCFLDGWDRCMFGLKS